MLDANIKAQLTAYLEKLQRPIELVATLNNSPKAQEIRDLLNDIVACSSKVSLREDGNASLIVVGDTTPEALARARSAELPLLHKPLRPAKLRALLHRMLGSA